MAIWRNHELEYLIGGPLDVHGLTESGLRRLIDNKVAESEYLDYKSSGPTSVAPKGGESWLNDFAKDVSAFANGRGGLLLYGVKESSKIPTEIVGVKSINLDTVEGALVAILTKFVSPIPEVEFITIPCEDTGPCLAVVVPPSRWAPHGVSSAPRGSDRRPLDYPVRAGAHTRWMTEPEIASRYLERGQFATAHAGRIEKLIAEAKSRLSVSDGIWVYLAVVPERLVDERMTADFVNKAAAWLPATRATSPLQGGDLTLSRMVVAPGRVILTDFPFGDSTVWMSGIYTELHVDGAAFFAVDGLARADLARQNMRELDLLELVDSLILAAQVAPRWARHQAGALGSSTLVAGVACHTRGATAQFDLHSSVAGGRHERVPTALGMMQQDPQMTMLFESSAYGDAHGELLIARMAAAGILQWFGIVEPLQISSEGRLVVEHWSGGPGSGNQVQAAQWNRMKFPE